MKIKIYMLILKGQPIQYQLSFYDNAVKCSHCILRIKQICNIIYKRNYLKTKMYKDQIEQGEFLCTQYRRKKW